MKIALCITLIMISADCFSQIIDVETGKIMDSTQIYMGQNDLPKDLFDKTKGYPNDSLVWISLSQKEFSGDYLKLDGKTYCGSLKCFTTPLIVDSATFQVLFSTTYSRDKNAVYSYNSQICPDCSDCCGGCSCEMFIVKNANPNTFRILNGPYATDGEYIYFYGLLINNIDYKSFKIVIANEFIALSIDKNHVYFGDEVFDKADPLTFYFDEKDIRNNYKIDDNRLKRYIIGDKYNKWEYYPIEKKVTKISEK